MYSQTDQQLMAIICNDVFDKSNFKRIVKKVKSIDFNDNYSHQLIWWASKNGTPNGANKIIPIFLELASNKRFDIRQFYDFKPIIDKVRQMIQNRQIPI